MNSSRAPLALVLMSATLVLAGCSGGTKDNTTVTGTVGVASGVTLSTGGVSTSLLPTKTITITATVTDDTNAAGVTWELVGDGALSAPTKTTVVYTAPAAVTGTSTPVITATSIADPTKTASATLQVLGTPVLSAADLFPAYVNVAYAARIVVAGGESSFTWTIDAGTLPAGLTLGTSTGAEIAISGTPTATGTATVTLKVVDAAARTASVDLTFVVNPTVTCLLNGSYAVSYNGFRDGTPATRVASLSIDSSGNVTGVEDFKSGSRSGIAESVTGTCEVSKNNAGVFNLKVASGNFKWNHAVANDLMHGRVQLTSGGQNTSGTGLFIKQDASAFSLASLAGDWAFGLVGAESQEDHVGLVGRLTVDASGVISAAKLDRNGGTPVAALVATGTMSAPDATGRGTISLTGGGETFTLAYYVVNANKLLVMDVDTDTSISLNGAMTRQSGSFSSASMDASTVLSLWGEHGSSEPRAAATLGLFSGASAGTLDAVLDSTGQGKSAIAGTYAGAYAVDPTSGRVTLTLTPTTGSRSFVAYLDGTSNGYVIENNSLDNNAGLLEAQTGPTFSNTLVGQFISNTQFPVVPGPLSLLPAMTIGNGILSATYGSGYFYIDTANGRGLGSLTTTGIGTDAIVIYEVDPSRVRVLRFGTSTTRNPMIDWIDR